MSRPFVNTGSFAAPATATTNTVSSNASTLERVSTNLKNSFQDVAINTVSSSAAQSAINGDSFADALKGQGKNILIYTAAKVAANEIGRAYHGTTDQYGNTVSEPTIGKPIQLTLHAGLGCAVGAASGGNCGSGAVAGVVGEQVAETGNKYGGFNQQTSIQLANAFGAISAGTYGNLTGQSDEKNADNIWTGSRIGQNAAENNFFFIPLVAAAGTATLAAIGDGDALKGAEKVNTKIGEVTAPVTNTLVDGADVVANLTGLAEDGATPVRDALNAAGNAYQTYVPEGSRQVLGLTGLTLGIGGAASLGKGLISGGSTTTTSLSTGVLREGYHATMPNRVESIFQNGFFQGTEPGRLGSGGVYVNNTSSGALSEFFYHNPDVTNAALIKV